MSKYNLSLPWKLFVSIESLCGFFLFWSLISDYSDSSWMDVIVSLFWIFFAAYYFFRLFDRLVIDENGFQYRSLGIWYSGKWSDVIKIANQKHLFPGLESLRQGAYISKAKLILGDNWLTPKVLFIPFSMFVWNWQESVQKQMVIEYIARTKAG